MTKAERAEELAYYRSDNDESSHWTKSAELEAAPPPVHGGADATHNLPAVAPESIVALVQRMLGN